MFVAKIIKKIITTSRKAKFVTNDRHIAHGRHKTAKGCGEI